MTPPSERDREIAKKIIEDSIEMSELEDAIALALASREAEVVERCIRLAYLAKNEHISIGKAIEAMNEGRSEEDIMRALRGGRT